MKAMSAVFIDVDLTLLDCESFRTFILNRYLGPDFFKVWILIRAYFNKRFKHQNVLKFKQDCLLNLKGKDRSKIDEVGSEFIKGVLLKNVREGALRCLNEYKQKGNPVYLASASPSFYIKILSDYFNLSGYFATELKFDLNQKYIGEFVNGDCIGEKKAKRIIEFSKNAGINLHSSIFYTDSFEDLPLLSAVGFPIAVWPDDKLKKICINKGWAIEYW